MKKDLAKVYNPKEFEDRTYAFWERAGYFHAEIDPEKKPYTVVIPPPNITGQLHMGHALDETLQDILIRFRRMQGYSALWLPGTDHASIATEARIVESLKVQGISKEDLGREGFLEKAWEWKDKYGGRIIEQLKKLGSSCDWERERFTLDEGCSAAVNEVFVNLYEKDLIYRGERIINWCPTCQTSISDAEVEYSEQKGHFWRIRYPFTDNSGFVEIATTRPETLLGDTAVAVHPDDERYKNHIGKMVRLPLMDREIPIVADTYVDMEFGTGVVKITPAHDPNDFEVGLRHNLPIINVMTKDAYINENGGKYAGMDRYQARKAVVKDLKEQGLLMHIEDHVHNVGECYRCSTTVEPRISKQWFVKMKPLAEPAIKVVQEGKTEFVPDRFSKIYYHWMENIKDWCISRQLWWGHRIPAYYCEDCAETVVSKTKPERCPKCKSRNMRQDEDTLDTWFSSALWPFSTLGWPEKTPDYEYFYPTSTLVTAYDIIFFWVARMIFSAIEHTGQVPFDTVFMHGLIRDSEGRKMSKSLGNGIDPLDVIEKYGADALRFTLATGNSPGNDMRYSEEKVKSSRNFANKLWNATRFILMNLPEDFADVSLPDNLHIEDKWVLNLYNQLVKEVTDNLEHFELGVAVSKLYDFIWDIFCDWYIELSKPRLQEGGDNAKNVQKILMYILTNVIKLLHPFMPFITEEIWQSIPHDDESIMISSWPVYNESLAYEEEQEFWRIIEAIKGIRNVRASMNVPPSKKTSLFIQTEFTQIFEESTSFFHKLASASSVEISSTFSIPSAARVVTDSAVILIPMDELVDKEKELERLEREKAICEKDVKVLSGKLSNESFVEKAPKEVVDKEREKLTRAQEKLENILNSMKELEA